MVITPQNMAESSSSQSVLGKRKPGAPVQVEIFNSKNERIGAVELYDDMTAAELWAKLLLANHEASPDHHLVIKS